MFRTHKRTLAFAPLFVALTLATACDDDPVELPEEDPGELVEAVQLTIGTETLDLSSGATEAITIPLGPTDVTAMYLDADGNEVGGLDAFELQFEPAVGDVYTFERSESDPFAGVLTGETAGEADDVNVQLFHIEEAHSDFDVFLNITVQ